MQSIELHNCYISDHMLRFLLEMVLMKSTAIQSIVIKHLQLSLDVARLLHGLAARKPLRSLTINGCGFNSAMLAELCIGIISAKNVEQLDLCNNEIGLSAVTQISSAPTSSAASSDTTSP